MYNRKEIHTKSVAFMSGKGGVGQTSLLLNIGCAQAKANHNSLYFDASHNLSEIEHLLNTKFNSYLTKENIDSVSIDNLIKPITNNFCVLASNLNEDFNNEPSLFEQYAFIDLVSMLDTFFDFLLIDIPNCYSKNNFLIASAADKIVFVIDDNPSSYSHVINAMQSLKNKYGCNNFSIVVNRVTSKKKGKEIFEVFSLLAAENTENIKIDYIGSVYDDEKVKSSILKQQLAYQQYPVCQFSNSISDISNNISESIKNSHSSKGTVEFFPAYCNGLY